MCSSISCPNTCHKRYKKARCISNVKISDCTESFGDNTSLAKWSSLDLLAEEEDNTFTSPTTADKEGKQRSMNIKFIIIVTSDVNTYLQTTQYSHLRIFNEWLVNVAVKDCKSLHRPASMPRVQLHLNILRLINPAKLPCFLLRCMLEAC